jgi:two-component system sensor histidine kinase HydH
MPALGSKLRRSAVSAGPVLIAILMGLVLVVSSALSYRDARDATVLVAERQGVGFLHRVERLLGHKPPHADELRALLEANHALGLRYVAIREHGAIVVEAGEALLADSRPGMGSPAFGAGRVRMLGPARMGGPPGHAAFGAGGLPPPWDHGDRLPPPGDGPGSPASGTPPPDFPLAPPPLADRPIFFAGYQPMPPHELIIEFEPISSDSARHRAQAVLMMSSCAAGLLTVAALLLWTRARRAERAEKRVSAQRHLAQLGEMSAVLAHEIRNPLAALKGHAQLVAEQVDDPAVCARVQRVINEAVRLEHLTTDLLDFARSGTINVAPASPAALLERAASATSPERIARRTEHAPALWSVDAGRIEQVLINLLENALAVTPEGVQVEAQALREGDALVYTVRDHGPGVPTSQRARIFEPFHTTKLRGTGLGLPVAKRIVQLHQGRIDVVAAVGGGAQFRVYIPRSSEAT